VCHHAAHPVLFCLFSVCGHGLADKARPSDAGRGLTNFSRKLLLATAGMQQGHALDHRKGVGDEDLAWGSGDLLLVGVAAVCNEPLSTLDVLSYLAASVL
jgi:hypothetical protein